MASDFVFFPPEALVVLLFGVLYLIWWGFNTYKQTISFIIWIVQFALAMYCVVLIYNILISHGQVVKEMVSETKQFGHGYYEDWSKGLKDLLSNGKFNLAKFLWNLENNNNKENLDEDLLL